MTNKSERAATFASEIILHLARLSHGEGNACGLTNAQWAALRYFALANRFSRTLLAFADYHVTTRGTASQTVKKLVEKRLLTRSPSQLDGRSSQIDLTAEGRALYEKDPFEAIPRAITTLSPRLRSELLAALMDVIGQVTEGRQRRRFGTCSTCRYLGDRLDQEGGGESYNCQLIGVQMLRSELDQLCINYESDKE